MRYLALVIAALVCAMVWLVLLVTTSFTGWVVGIGLLGMLMLTSRSG